MGKRSNGEGSIWKRERDGKLIRWEGAITYLDGEAGILRYGGMDALWELAQSPQ